MSKRIAFWNLLKRTADKYTRDNIPWLAASLAYYALFSLAPTFIFVSAIGAFLFGEEAVQGQIVNRLQEYVGYDAAMAIQNMVEAGMELTFGPVSNILTALVVLYVATNVFSHLKQTLDTIWEVEYTDRHWVSSFLLDRLLSLAMIIGTGGVLLTLVVANVFLTSFGDVLAEYVPAFTHVFIWDFGNFIVSFIIISLLFIMINWVIPDANIAFEDVWLGSILSAFMFTLGKMGFSIYLAHSSMITLFGAASSFVVILIWVYYSVQILYLGAAFCQSYSVEYGSFSRGVERQRRSRIRRQLRKVKKLRRKR